MLSGLDWQTELEQKYPNSSIFHLFQVMIHSLDTDTCSNYGAGLLCFTQFCDSIKVSEADCMPTLESLISQFTAAFVGTSSEKMLNNWLAGLQFWHIINGAPWHASHLLHHTRRGFTKIIPPLARRAK
jgi:hypothetical protein